MIAINEADSGRPYKLRMRCLCCVAESYPAITIDGRARTTSQIDRAVRIEIAAQPFECERCGGNRSTVVAYFAAPHTA